MTPTQQKTTCITRYLGRTLILGAMVFAVAGCVVEDPYPSNAYRTYPDSYSRYDYPQYYAPDDTVVVVHGRDSYYPQYDRADDRYRHDYDDNWKYGRRGNANFHGTDRDDIHDDK